MLVSIVMLIIHRSRCSTMASVIKSLAYPISSTSQAPFIDREWLWPWTISRMVVLIGTLWLHRKRLEASSVTQGETLTYNICNLQWQGGLHPVDLDRRYEYANKLLTTNYKTLLYLLGSGKEDGQRTLLYTDPDPIEYVHDYGRLMRSREARDWKSNLLDVKLSGNPLADKRVLDGLSGLDQ